MKHDLVQEGPLCVETIQFVFHLRWLNIMRKSKFTFTFIFNSQTSNCSNLRTCPRAWCVDVDVGKSLYFVVWCGKDCRFIDHDGECVFFTVKDLIHFYLGPLTSWQGVADVSWKAWPPVQRCGNENSPCWMQPQSRGSVSDPGAGSRAGAPGGEVEHWGVGSPLIAARIHLNRDSPFLAQSCDRCQEVVLGKLLFRWRSEYSLPRRCKKSLAVSVSVFLFR